MWVYGSYLNLLDPLGKLERADGLHDGGTSGFIVEMTDILTLPDSEGWSILVNLVPERYIVAGPHPRQSTYKVQLSLGALPFTLCSVLEIKLPNVSKL